MRYGVSGVIIPPDLTTGNGKTDLDGSFTFVLHATVPGAADPYIGGIAGAKDLKLNFFFANNASAIVTGENPGAWSIKSIDGRIFTEEAAWDGREKFVRTVEASVSSQINIPSPVPSIPTIELPVVNVQPGLRVAEVDFVFRRSQNAPSPWLPTFVTDERSNDIANLMQITQGRNQILASSQAMGYQIAAGLRSGVIIVGPADLGVPAGVYPRDFTQDGMSGAVPTNVNAMVQAKVFANVSAFLDGAGAVNASGTMNVQTLQLM